MNKNDVNIHKILTIFNLVDSIILKFCFEIFQKYYILLFRYFNNKNKIKIINR